MTGIFRYSIPKLAASSPSFCNSIRQICRSKIDDHLYPCLGHLFDLYGGWHSTTGKFLVGIDNCKYPSLYSLRRLHPSFFADQMFSIRRWRWVCLPRPRWSHIAGNPHRNRFPFLEVTKGRYASDREAGHGSHKIGVCPADGFARVLADALLVDAVRAAGQDKDRLA